MSDDTLPPPPEEPTLTELSTAANDSELPPPLIPRGFAQHAFCVALSELARAFHLVEETGMALARALDSEEGP